jgi:Tol biopolymer transport system component
LWVASGDGHSARYFTASGTPQVTLPIPGWLVGGDSIAAYVEVQATDAAGQTSEQLWRYPVNGSQPTQLASSPKVNGVTFSYARVSGLVGNRDGVLATWFSLPRGSSTLAFFIQWAPLK